MILPRLRVLQLGCGGITGTWFHAATHVHDLEFVGLCDLNPGAARLRRDEFGLLSDIPIFSDFESSLKELRPDVVFDCTIPAAHTSNAILAFENGAHVLSEKPMSDTLEGARRALDASAACGKIYAITQNYRYANGPRRLRAFLESGALGKVHTVNADMYLAPHFGGFREQMEHVLLLDMAIHTFDMARFLSGTQAERVFCHEYNPPGSWFDGDACAMATFQMTSDVVFSFRGSWCATGLPSGFASHWRIVGDRGTVLWDGADDFRCEVESGEEGFIRATEKLEIPTGEFGTKEQGHGGIIKEFLECVRTGQLPETHANDNLESLKMVLGAVQSSRAQALISL